MAKKFVRRTTMKQLYIIVEGQTELEFVKSILNPYLSNYNIFNVFAIVIKKTGGGFINYVNLRNDILLLLKQQKNIIVSTFVDFYAIPTNMPKYFECQEKTNNYEKLICLEKALKQDINDYRFLPYIQFHEFETLLFSEPNKFSTYYEDDIVEELNQIFYSFNQNPEQINDGKDTAPSKRIKKIIPKYNKVYDGNIMALEIGINKMLEKCQHFATWIDKLKNLMLS